MTNLTDKWKKGELPSGRYWVKYRSGRIDEWDLLGGKTIETKPEIVEILVEVPSYEEWQELKEFANYSIHNRDELTRQINFWMQENTKLKELLKDSHDIIYETAFKLRKVSEIDKCNEIRKKIREVLGAEYGFETPKYYVRKRAKDTGE